jgi:16S rRNA C1402 N4-methylase RsmH
MKDEDEFFDYNHILPVSLSNHHTSQGSFGPLTKRVSKKFINLVKPSKEEIEFNPRSRSAKLRVYQRTKHAPIHEIKN